MGLIPTFVEGTGEKVMRQGGGGIFALKTKKTIKLKKALKKHFCSDKNHPLYRTIRLSSKVFFEEAVLENYLKFMGINL